MKKSCYILPVLFSLFVVNNLIGQTTKFLWPLKGKITLNGNYGELRPNHFHAGLDFSTGRVCGVPVYAIADGYVSRIKVSPYGYGNSVYITHANNQVSLYGHLENFSENIKKLVEQEQIKQEFFEVELFPEPSRIPVKAGELIGWSGNTGSSAGPHLHFEIRNEITEAPINPLLFYKLEDKQAPVITHVALYNLEDTVAPKILQEFSVLNKLKPSLLKDSLKLDKNILGVAFSGYDCFTPSGGKNAIFSVKIYLDEQLHYYHQLESIPFDGHRYVNEYAEKVSGVHYQKCFLPTVYPSGMYKECRQKGRIVLRDTLFHKLDFVAADEYGNQSKLTFYVKANKISYYKLPKISGDTYFNCTKDNVWQKEDLMLSVPRGSLYYSTPLTFITDQKNGLMEIKPAEANLNNPVKLTYIHPAEKYPMRDKRLLAINGQICAPKISGDSVSFFIKSFGKLKYVIDTMPPKINPVGRIPKAIPAGKESRIYFIIQDNLSGIKHYRFTVSDSWMLSEFDGKNKKLCCVINEKITPGKYSCKLEVTDVCGNKRDYAFSILVN